MSKKTKIGEEQSLELFLRYWKYGENYKSSTVLVDLSYNIMAFFDNESTDLITIIVADCIYDKPYIIDGKNKTIIKHKLVKFEPFNFKKQKGKTTLFQYNKNYFKNLFKK